jgi:phage tail-like protein
MAGYYPPAGFHFRVTFNVDGAKENDSRFQKVGGLTAELTTEEVIEGGENRFSHRLPSRAKYGALVLERGMLSDSGLIAWVRDAIESLVVKPAEILIELLNENHETLSTWSVVGAYPIKWSVSEFKASENGYVTESLELAFQYFRPV